MLEGAESLQAEAPVPEPSIESVEPPEAAAIASALGSWDPEVPAEPAAEPVLETPEATADVAAGEATPDEVGGVVIAWPWDTQASDEETPAEADSDLIADIELVTPPSEPVVDELESGTALESLLVEPPAEASAEVDSVQTPEEEPAEAVAELEGVEQALEDSETPVEVDADPALAAEPAEVAESPGTSRDEIADFIFDLENVTDIPETTAEARGAKGSETDGQTCGECVYDETCPNRDQRSPQECGSFQWKIA
jgi:hypothetical protein